MKEYITTSDGRISVKRSEFIGHSCFANPMGDHIIIRTKDCPSGKCVNYLESREDMFKAGKEINEQLNDSAPSTREEI